MRKLFFELREEIGQFMETKGKPVMVLQSLEWLHDLAFMVDITEQRCGLGSHDLDSSQTRVMNLVTLDST